MSSYGVTIYVAVWLSDPPVVTLSADSDSSSTSLEHRHVFNITAVFTHAVSGVTTSSLRHDATDAFDSRLVGSGSGTVFVFELSARSPVAGRNVSYWLDASAVSPRTMDSTSQVVEYGR